MQEVLELRVSLEFAHLLFAKSEGKNLGEFVKVVQVAKDDPRYHQIPVLQRKLNDEDDETFFYSWQIKRKYDKVDLTNAKLFNILIKSEFEPCGEECGTVYDEKTACPICRAGAKQCGPLVLQKGSIPKKDITRTIAGEIVVSGRCVDAIQKSGVNGGLFEPVIVKKGDSGYYQLNITSPEIYLTSNTIAGIDPFDLSEYSEALDFSIAGGPSGGFEREIYKCPNGHTIGLNLLSEPYVVENPAFERYDLFYTRQKVGVRRGYLRPFPIMICSPTFREMVIKEKLTGFDFEVAHIEKNVPE